MPLALEARLRYLGHSRSTASALPRPTPGVAVRQFLSAGKGMAPGRREAPASSSLGPTFRGIEVSSRRNCDRRH